MPAGRWFFVRIKGDHNSYESKIDLYTSLDEAPLFGPYNSLEEANGRDDGEGEEWKDA